jgi:hypothetical protein
MKDRDEFVRVAKAAPIFLGYLMNVFGGGKKAER